MLFQVTRTSLWGDTKPLNNCIPIKLKNVDIRTLRSPEEFDERLAKYEGKWLNVGTNHRINQKGYITRDMGFVEKWGIEINSLEELMTLKDMVGHDLVLTTSHIDKETPEIEIYDDYRE